MGRVIAVMQRLRDAGNTLLVVEHDPQIMLAADRLLDLGPGAGEHGGRIVSYGTPGAGRRRSRLADRRLARRPQTPAAAARRAARQRQRRPRLRREPRSSWSA